MPLGLGAGRAAALQRLLRDRDRGQLRAGLLDRSGHGCAASIIDNRQLPTGFAADWTGSRTRKCCRARRRHCCCCCRSWWCSCVSRRCMKAGRFRCRAARGAARHARHAGVLQVDRHAERHLLQDRPRDRDRPGRKERDSDRGVRGGGTATWHDAVRRRADRGPAALAPDPDDLDGLHPRRVPARGVVRVPAPLRVTKSAPA
jgi:hypothetical protein